MNLSESYKLLNIPESASDEDVTRAFKKMAMLYHPDKNRDKVEWANAIMARINEAYSIITTSRFETSEEDELEEKETRRHEEEKSRQEEMVKELLRDHLIKLFVEVREDAKDCMYKYFQYSLNNFARRDQILNKSVFNEVVLGLRKSYHKIKDLEVKTRDEELIEHFAVFKEMIINFYKASECINIIDSYSDLTDVAAYRIYFRGDEALHYAEKEIFFDRHNRGYFKKEMAYEYVRNSTQFFKSVLEKFPESSWSVESRIKLEYAVSLLAYLELFFQEED